jgi:hypothetical protein
MTPTSGINELKMTLAGMLEQALVQNTWIRQNESTIQSANGHFTIQTADRKCGPVHYLTDFRTLKTMAYASLEDAKAAAQ